MKRATLTLATAALAAVAGLASAQPRYDQPRYDQPREGRERASITLFMQPGFNGRTFQSFREITNLPKQYNDRAMSLRIDGRRPWQVCADSDFRGHCEVFDHDVRDLREFGLDGQVSSARPVR
ncbi:beta/gamma crystallin-related protein [Phenylobacterium sp.]|uniref:beta/gamma crystallin-related protein n=1 Tax=Phenylobacterium sp. TaxID=1871053 RepID=UPI00374D76A9